MNESRVTNRWLHSRPWDAAITALRWSHTLYGVPRHSSMIVSLVWCLFGQHTEAGDWLKAAAIEVITEMEEAEGTINRAIRS